MTSSMVPKASPEPRPARQREGERRAAPRTTSNRHEASRQRARASEFAVMAFGGVVAAVLIAGALADLLSRPLGAAQTALASK